MRIRNKEIRRARHRREERKKAAERAAGGGAPATRPVASAAAARPAPSRPARHAGAPAARERRGSGGNAPTTSEG